MKQVLKDGSGPRVTIGEKVKFHFMIARTIEDLALNRTILNSFESGTTMECVLGEGILLPEIEEAILGLHVGATVRIVIEDEFGEPLAAELFVEESASVNPDEGFVKSFRSICHPVPKITSLESRYSDTHVPAQDDQLFALSSKLRARLKELAERITLQIQGRLNERELLPNMATELRRWRERNEIQVKLAAEVERAINARNITDLRKLESDVSRLGLEWIGSNWNALAKEEEHE